MPPSPTQLGVDGQTVTVTYKGGEKKVPFGGMCGCRGTAARRQGQHQAQPAIILFPRNEADGTLVSGLFGKDGVVPPM